MAAGRSKQLTNGYGSLKIVSQERQFSPKPLTCSIAAALCMYKLGAYCIDSLALIIACMCVRKWGPGTASSISRSTMPAVGDLEDVEVVEVHEALGSGVEHDGYFTRDQRLNYSSS